MTSSATGTPSVFGVALLPPDSLERLDALKQMSGLSWKRMAAAIGVDARRVYCWRRGTYPSGESMLSLVQLATCARRPGRVARRRCAGDPRRHEAVRRAGVDGQGTGRTGGTTEKPSGCPMTFPNGSSGSGTSPACRGRSWPAASGSTATPCGAGRRAERCPAASTSGH